MNIAFFTSIFKKKKVHIVALYLVLQLVFTGSLFAQAPTNSDVITINSDGTISDIEQHNERIYVGGNYTQIEINGVSYSQENYSVIDTSTRSLASVQHFINGPVEDIIIHEGLVYVVGEFTQVENKEHPYIAVFNENDNTLTTSSLKTSGPVYSLAIKDGLLYGGGNFESALGQQRENIFEYDIQKNQLTQWAPQVNGVIYDIYIFGNKLFIGGSFTAVENEPRSQIAAFDLVSKNLLGWSPQIDGTVSNISLDGESLLVVTSKPLDDSTVEELRYRIDPERGDTVVIDKEIAEVTPPSTIQIETPTTGSGEKSDMLMQVGDLGFLIPSLGDILTFAIRAFFAIAGLAAMFYLLLGAFNWVVSGGDKDAITAARDKIQAAVVGLIMMVVVLSLIWTLEQVIFKRRICLGISCPVTLPSLLEPLP